MPRHFLRKNAKCFLFCKKWKCQKSPAKLPKPEGGMKKPAVSKTGARVFSAYGPSEEVGNPGAGVSRRKVVSDYIRGAKSKKK